MANVKIKDADNTDKYMSASGAGSDVDPFVVTHNVGDPTPLSGGTIRHRVRFTIEEQTA
jgi:hypothetical protein